MEELPLTVFTVLISGFLNLVKLAIAETVLGLFS